MTYRSLWAILAACTLTACASAPQRDGPGGVIITDRRGERWDISHAVEHYGFSRYGFEFGIGRNAIPPLNSPDMSEPGDADHPPASAGHEIIGFSSAEEIRSYPIQPLRRHEIVNEEVGNTQAAVAY